MLEFSPVDNWVVDEIMISIVSFRFTHSHYLPCVLPRETKRIGLRTLEFSKFHHFVRFFKKTTVSTSKVRFFPSNKSSSFFIFVFQVHLIQNEKSILCKLHIIWLCKLHKLNMQQTHCPNFWYYAGCIIEKSPCATKTLSKISTLCRLHNGKIPICSQNIVQNLDIMQVA